MLGAVVFLQHGRKPRPSCFVKSNPVVYHILPASLGNGPKAGRGIKKHRDQEKTNRPGINSKIKRDPDSNKQG